MEIDGSTANTLYIMRKKELVGSNQVQDKWVHFIFLDDGRLPGFAEIVGGVTDPALLDLFNTGSGFRSLAAGVSVTLYPKPGAQVTAEPIHFVLQMYGKTDRYQGGTCFEMDVWVDGKEYYLPFPEDAWSEEDAKPGQIRFEFNGSYDMVIGDVALAVKGDWKLPPQVEERPVDTSSIAYQNRIEASLMQTGNTARLQALFQKAARGEEVTLAFIGGSITQGAGATPLPENCYARKTYEGFLELLKEWSGLETSLDPSKIHFCKAGVGGTPSELGMVRFDRDVVRGADQVPDLVVVEFAVNDDGDETKGICYESLVRKILQSPGKPAVILLFSVFANCWNLQDRLAPVGRAYQLPMVSIKDAVADQFSDSPETRLVSKNQFFYDRLHPSNIGHTIMADSLLHVLKIARDRSAMEDTLDVAKIAPVIGDTFTNIKLLDRESTYDKAVITEGSFCEVDEVLQGVEMDTNHFPTKEFPYNWKHTAGTEPFKLTISCTSLVLVFKDSESSQAGKAEVYADGKLVLSPDPKIGGWVHCNAVILFTDWEAGAHEIEIKMAPGDEDKEFTILGFGYVE
jgi:lysophospholipase L1-like esterase